jgi:hypothetical protein
VAALPDAGAAGAALAAGAGAELAAEDPAPVAGA